MSAQSDLGASVALLILVGVSALAVGLWARQWKRKIGQGGPRVLSSLSLGQRERLVEVLHEGEILLLGVTSQQITLIRSRPAQADPEHRSWFRVRDSEGYPVQSTATPTQDHERAPSRDDAQEDQGKDNELQPKRNNPGNKSKDFQTEVKDRQTSGKETQTRCMLPESRVMDAQSRVMDAQSRVVDARSRVVDARSRVVDARSDGRFEAPGLVLAAFFFALALCPSTGLAQNIPLFEAVPAKGGGTNYSVPVQTVILLTALSFVPAMLMLMTSFTRILIVLSLLRQAMGLVTTPPNAVLIGLALFITAAVMAPVAEKVYGDAWQPYVAGRLNLDQAVDRGVEPVKAFMLRQTRADDLNLFVRLSGRTYEKPEDVPMTAVIPAFAISEIRTAFLIGFVIYLPFLAIDFAVASILTALGMVMVSPITFSLPLKLIVFVLADGWAMLVGGLVESFRMSG